jgi:ribosomal protein S18 acetylase RimI-like enzyme
MMFYRKLDNPRSLAVIDAEPYGRQGLLITRINVPYAHRSKGIASDMLREACAHADLYMFKLWLEIVPSGRLTYDQLEAFYCRYGFRRHVTGIWVRRPA